MESYICFQQTNLIEKLIFWWKLCRPQTGEGGFSFTVCTINRIQQRKQAIGAEILQFVNVVGAALCFLESKGTFPQLSASASLHAMNSNCETRLILWCSLRLRNMWPSVKPAVQGCLLAACVRRVSSGWLPPGLVKVSFSMVFGLFFLWWNVMVCFFSSSFLRGRCVFSLTRRFFLAAYWF